MTTGHRGSEHDAAPVSSLLPGAVLSSSSRRRDSLVRRLTLLNLLVLSLTLLVSFMVIAGSSWVTARDRQVDSAIRSAELLANNLAPIMVFEDPNAGEHELSALGRRGEMLWIRVLRADGSLFAGWDRDPAAARDYASLPPTLSAANAIHAQFSGRELELRAPIVVKGEQVGMIYWRESSLAVQQFMIRMLAIGALVILAAILGAAWVLSRVQRASLAPIVELSDLAEHVALRQDYGQRATVRRRDEVGRLAERFNAMLKRIEVWQGELNEQLHREQVAGQHMQALAHRDSLTHLPNRRAFQSELQRCVAQSLENKELMALMFIDLDNFKTVNDQHGHDMGDRVLCAVAERMAHVVRTRDVLCRLGGDEFALLLPGLPDVAAATQLAERLLASVRAPLWLDGQQMPIGATLGLAFCPADATDPMDLLSQADAAMYAAKHAGKNTYRCAGDAHV